MYMYVVDSKDTHTHDIFHFLIIIECSSKDQTYRILLNMGIEMDNVQKERCDTVI